jgi:hypothetical protein
MTSFTPPPGGRRRHEAHGLLTPCLLAAVVLAAAAGRTAAQEAPAASLGDYLATWKIDRAGRRPLEEPGPWTAAKQQAAVRVIARLARVPSNLFAAWAADAALVSSLPADDRVPDRLVRATGQATFVASVALSPDEAEVAGRKQIDVVRLVADDGTAIDVLADRVPAAWPRGRVFAEPAGVVGLPLSGAGSPPAAVVDGAGEPAAILLAAQGVSWFPKTPLGELGVDYALFDSVGDGQKLVAGDTEAFYAVLAAAGRTTPEAIAAAAGPPGDIVPLIDPGQDWFRTHRGDPVTIEGVVRRATRITVDDPQRRLALGTDHYWELFVFVPTPLIKVNDRLQEDFPVVCCVRSLPSGMPSGQQMGERVRVAGFAFKRYGYPLPDVRISSSQGDREQKDQRQETALVIGRQPVWLPAAKATREVDALGWAFLGIAGLIGAALVATAWLFARDSRRRERVSRRELPDRIDLP